MPGVIIVGAGQAGYQVAESLRHEGYEGHITLIGDEAHPPYQRPPLSKQYLLGKTSEEQLLFRAREYYPQHGIDLLLRARITAIHRAQHEVELDDGERLAYDKLVLATGARARTLLVAGAELQGVCYLRTLDDVKDIQAHLDAVQNAVVIGGGFIGLEFAAVAQTLGKQVTVIEAMERLMARVVAPPVSEYFAQLHRSHGVQIVTGAGVSAIQGNGNHVSAVLAADGREFPAQLVVVGIGVIANDELAAACGLACDKGIVVNNLSQTSDPDIYAAGDCARYTHPFAGEAVRLESVQNAVDQAKTAAAAVVGKAAPYTTVPWFWSDQYDKKLQMVGLSTGTDTHVTRGDMASGKFSVFYFRNGVLRAIDSINKPADHITGRKLLAGPCTLTPGQAADENYPLKSALSG